MLVRMRYVVARKNADGSLRWYWQRKGFPITRLPDDENHRFAAVAKLNEAADANADTGAAEGTVAWAIDIYRQSTAFKKLAPSTRSIYERWMIAMTETVGQNPLASMTRGKVKEILEGIESKGGRIHCAAVITRIVEIARDHNYLREDIANKLKLEDYEPREQIWTPEDEKKFFDACDKAAAEGDKYAEGIKLGIQILFYTGQRPVDMRKMMLSHYNGDVISVVQKKTKKRLEVPCHSELRAILDAARTNAKGLYFVTMPDGRPFSKSSWDWAFSRIRSAAGLDHLQARDIRRTAAVRLGEAGCTEAEVAAVTGHTIASARNALNEVYLRRTTKMARSAIAKLEAIK